VPSMKAKWSKPPISAPLSRSFPAPTALVHISQLANQRVGKVTDVVKEGDMLKVKVLEISKDGKIRLSHKAVLEDERKSRTVNKTTLDNGVRIVSMAMPHMRSVSMGVWVHVGARDETDAKAVFPISSNT
jgi:translation initiation factor 2 alpha subunit (eIF-2alpha)